MDREFSNDDLIQFYTEQLQNAGVSSATTLTEAVKTGTVDMSLDISKKITPKRQQEIINNNPDSVEIGEKTYDITYAYESYYRKYTASIIVPVEEIFEVEEVPVLPSGRTLSVKVTDAAYERFSGETLEELKAKAEEYSLAKQWEAFRHLPDAPKATELKEFDPLKDSLPELPNPVVFGTNPRTHESA